MQTKTNIKAEIIADSINQQGDRITTYILTFPRFILAELNTHRVFSKNSASSRAIPFEKMVEMVETDPFTPIAWQFDHKGMQGNEYITDSDMIEYREDLWLEASFKAIKMAKRLNYNIPNFDGKIPEGEDREGVTKQLCNRLLEPFMWHTTLCTFTESENFFNLRCPQYEYYNMLTGNQQFFKSKKDWLQYCNNKPLPKAKHISKIPENDVEWLQINKSQAEIHMQALAEAMWNAMNESIPKTLQSGEWHIPFGDDITMSILDQRELAEKFPYISSKEDLKIRIATARCARLSYMTFEGKIDYEKDIKLHDTLLDAGHFSPFEHCARAMSEEEYYTFIKGKSNANWDTDLVTDNTYEISAQFDHSVLGWCNNFKGFVQYRYLIEH